MACASTSVLVGVCWPTISRVLKMTTLNATTTSRVRIGRPIVREQHTATPGLHTVALSPPFRA
jgi:hypothetical protein